MGLVKIIAAGMRRRLPNFVDFDDLVQAGTLGLVDAARKFTPDKQIAFSTYAKHRIRGAILDSLRESDNASRQMRKWQRRIDAAISQLSAQLERDPDEAEIAAQLGIGLDRLRDIRLHSRGLDHVSASSPAGEDVPVFEIPTQPAAHPDSIWAKKELSEVLAQAVEELAPRHRSVVRLYYAGEMTMREIGDRLGVKESRVCQVHKIAIAQLGNWLRANSITSSTAM